MQENHLSNDTRRIYSWIPNLTSKINFQYITDEINYDGESRKILIKPTEDENIKKFEIQATSSSDNLKEGQLGLLFQCSGTLSKDDSTGDIIGTYIEEYPPIVLRANNLSEARKRIVSVNFTISENGFIEIYDIIWSVGSSQVAGGYKNRLLGIYSNIKNVLHKDVHHDSKEDLSIRVYANQNTYKNEILEQLILSLKAFERSIKDSNDIKYMLSKYKRKTHQAEGYLAYLKTYTIILNDEAQLLKEEGRQDLLNADILKENNSDWQELKAKGNEKITQALKIESNTKRANDIAISIIASAINLIKQEEVLLDHKQKPYLLFLAMMTLFLPAFIASLNMVSKECGTLSIMHSTKDAFFLALSYMLVATFIGYFYTSRAIVYELYYHFAHNDKRRFMRMKNEMVLGESLAIKLIIVIMNMLAIASVVLIVLAIFYSKIFTL